MNPPLLGVAIIGSGIFVREQHLPAVQASPYLTLKAIYSRSLKSAQDVAANVHGVDFYSEDSDKSLKDLLARQDITGVIIALPITVQPEYIKQALRAGKHVLAEKPLAKDVATAKELIEWYHSNIDTSKVTYGVAEQFRYLKDVCRGAEVARDFGRVIGYRFKFGALTQAGNRYFETSWRKIPEYQGGFLLDGGVHFVAAMRVLLGSEAKVVRLSAFTTQLQEHLPPVDTVDTVLKLENGCTANFSVSFGTTFTGMEHSIACERGSILVTRDTVTSKPKGGEQVTETTPSDVGGVELEVSAWAKSLVDGKQDDRQRPEEALADLELIEAMLNSGAQDGKPVELKLQM
ncbi:NAD(P)-binding protein [Acrodontium crateriforme]|uniref:NAD(P)-binding protein n=1 Tax=Acrodontium crateriforme TaxID=150365 RepID=A0AAQ3M2U9_9PEZI|nr:NAD(P)-binding protein [Acrodontium crateriforme]